MSKMNRQDYPGTSPYEPIIGFSRAVHIGNTIHVSGTGPVGADDADAAGQTRQILSIAKDILAQAGASFSDVVRTRMYLTHAEDWEAVGQVHGEVFRDIRPAATMVVVAALLNPKWRVEIEFDAVVNPAFESAKTTAEGQ
jgi:enamine deaminase RidA (YjgF/YER057c/UK114 family)